MLDDDEKLCYLIVRSISFYKLSNLTYATSNVLQVSMWQIMNFKTQLTMVCMWQMDAAENIHNQSNYLLTKCRMSGQ